MKRQWLKNSLIMLVVILFSMTTGIAMAEKKHWFVVKDIDGACKVIETETVAEQFKTIAGPFKTKKEAKERKAKDCPKRSAQTTEKIRRQHEQAEGMRIKPDQQEEAQNKHLKQNQTFRELQQQTEKVKAKAQEKIEQTKAADEKVKEKTKEPVTTDKKN